MRENRNSDEDPFRWCACGADCYADEPEHTDECPSVTGVYPVTEQDLGIRGPNDPYAHGMRCMDCEADFKVGDHYTHREVEASNPLLPGIEGAAVYEVVCLGCAALEAVKDA